MRSLALAAIVSLFSVCATSAETSRIDRVEQWLKALLQHELGTDDDPVYAVGSWSARDMRALWIDTSNLLALMRNPRHRSHV